jgi:hypothetical protein
MAAGSHPLVGISLTYLSAIMLLTPSRMSMAVELSGVRKCLACDLSNGLARLSHGSAGWLPPPPAVAAFAWTPIAIVRAHRFLRLRKEAAIST